MGETSVDKMRCDHLSSHYEITEMLIEDIGKVASRYCHRNEYSMNKAGKRAKKYLEQIYEQAAFWLKEIQSQESIDRTRYCPNCGEPMKGKYNETN